MKWQSKAERMGMGDHIQFKWSTPEGHNIVRNKDEYQFRRNDGVIFDLMARNLNEAKKEIEEEGFVNQP